jgi:replication factor C subunit 1
VWPFYRSPSPVCLPIYPYPYPYPNLTLLWYRRTVVRTEYLPSLRYILTKPLRRAESDPGAIEGLLKLMQDYCISREQFDYVLSVTSFKTKGSWGEDPMKEVPTKVKSSFTRTFNQTGQVSECL